MQNQSAYLSLMGITQWICRGSAENETQVEGEVWGLYDDKGLLKGIITSGQKELPEVDKRAVGRLISDMAKAISLSAELGNPELGQCQFFWAFKPDEAQKQALSTRVGYHEFPFYVQEMLQNPALKREVWQVMKKFRSMEAT